jgi:hypothetical protein
MLHDGACVQRLHSIVARNFGLWFYTLGLSMQTELSRSFSGEQEHIMTLHIYVIICCCKIQGIMIMYLPTYSLNSYCSKFTPEGP